MLTQGQQVVNFLLLYNFKRTYEWRSHKIFFCSFSCGRFDEGRCFVDDDAAVGTDLDLRNRHRVFFSFILGGGNIFIWKTNKLIFRSELKNLRSLTTSDRPKPEFEPKPKNRNFGLVWTDTETERQSIPKPKPKFLFGITSFLSSYRKME